MATKIYIAGKITGDPDYKAKFEEAENFYKKKDFTVLTPTCLPIGMQPSDYMRICFARLVQQMLLLSCQTLSRVRGAEVEHAYCRYIDKNIRHYEDDRNKAQRAAKISADLLTSIAGTGYAEPCRGN